MNKKCSQADQGEKVNGRSGHGEEPRCDSGLGSEESVGIQSREDGGRGCEEKGGRSNDARSQAVQRPLPAGRRWRDNG